MAAQNEGGGGAAFGFMNMNMAGNAGAGMYQQMAQQQELMERRQRLMDHQQLEAEMARVKAEAERGVAAQAGSWTCPQCGTANLGKFCELRHEETGTQAGRYVGLRLRPDWQYGEILYELR